MGSVLVLSSWFSWWFVVCVWLVWLCLFFGFGVALVGDESLVPGVVVLVPLTGHMNVLSFQKPSIPMSIDDQ